MTDLMRGPCMCGKDKGGDSLAFPFPPRIDEARPSQRGAGAAAAPPSARVPSREKVKGGGGEKASYCSSSSLRSATLFLL